MINYDKRLVEKQAERHSVPTPSRGRIGFFWPVIVVFFLLMIFL